MARKAARQRTWVGEVTITNEQRALRVPRKWIGELVAFVAAAEGRAVESLDLLVAGADRMADLNDRHMGHAGPTDVLSFDLGTGPAGGLVGQLVVCADVASEQARLRGHSASKELLLYVTHGLLHVMGYDDLAEPDAARMHARENELLEAFGVGRVY